MKRGRVLLDSPDLREVGRVVPNGTRFGGSDLTPLVPLHCCQSSQNDLVSALPPSSPDLEQQVARTGLNLNRGGVGHAGQYTRGRPQDGQPETISD